MRIISFRKSIAAVLGVFIFILTIIFFTFKVDRPYFDASIPIVDIFNQPDTSAITNRKFTHCDSSYALTEFDCRYAGRLFNGCYVLNETQVLLPLRLVTLGLELNSKVDSQEKIINIRPTDIALPTTDHETYHSSKSFINFHNYHVERRPRVLLVTADEGIPLSTQWDQRGYPYPIQIAQFGLSHYGKRLQLSTPSSPVGKSLQANEVDLLATKQHDGETEKAFFRTPVNTRNWQEIKPMTAGIKSFMFSGCADNANSHVSFRASRQSHWDYFLLTGRNWSTGSFVRLQVLWSAGDGRQKNKTLIYHCGSKPDAKMGSAYSTISSDRTTATFWMPACASHTTADFRVSLARELHTDLAKAFAATGGPLPQKRGWNTKYSSVLVHSVDLVPGPCATPAVDGGLVERLGLARATTDAISSATELAFHESRFLAASSWLLRHFDHSGGWPIPVERRLNGISISPGWYSAMGQGHGISLMVRAFNFSHDYAYLMAASKAILLYNRTVLDGGVQSHFLSNPELPWYEEYPTEPGSHVLNGFIYSLLGLYDFIQTAEHHTGYRLQVALAKHLLTRGLHSLSVLLPLFDSGTGSFYDLRHLNRPVTSSGLYPNRSEPDVGEGPMRARWSYHKLHVEQLHLLADLYWRTDPTKAGGWRRTAERWTAYMAGHRSPHN